MNLATTKSCNSIIKKAIFQCFIFLTQSIRAPGGTTLDMNSGEATDLLPYLVPLYKCLPGIIWLVLVKSPVSAAGIRVKVKTTHGSFQNKSHCNFVIICPKVIIIKVSSGKVLAPGSNHSYLSVRHSWLWSSFEFRSYKAWPEFNTKADWQRLTVKRFNCSELHQELIQMFECWMCCKY